MSLLLVTQFTTRSLPAYTLIRLAVTKVLILQLEWNPVVCCAIQGIMQFLYSVYQTLTDIREVLLLQNVVRCSTHLSHLKLRHVAGA